MTLPYLAMMDGDTTVFPFTITDDGTPVDLTGMEITFTVRRYLSDAEPFITKTLGDGIAVVDAEEGTITVTMEPTDTDELAYHGYQESIPYNYDIRTLDDYEQVHTRARGVLYIYRHATVTAP